MKQQQLIANWRSELNRLWSVRIAILSALLAGAAEVLPEMREAMSPGIYAALFIVLFAARMTRQTKRAQSLYYRTDHTHRDYD